MDRITLNALQGAAGTASGDKVYVDDVFSTFLYEGTDTNHRIQNGIALGTTKPEDGNSLNLSATHQRLVRTSALSGASASKTFTLSAWVKIPDTSVYGELFYFKDTNTRFSVGFGNYLSIAAWNSSNTKFLDAYTASNVPITPGAWNHILVSFDMTSTSNRYCYVNDSSVSLTWGSYSNDNILFNSPDVAIFGEDDADNRLSGSLSNFYFDQTYRDLSTTLERRKFYAADGTPATGQASLSPIIYYNCDTLSTTNAGSGGDFTFIDSPTLNDFGPYIGTGEARGGMVWIKKRDNNDSHALFDTERGVQKYLKSDTSDNEYTRSDALSAFNFDGFSFNGAFGAANSSGDEYVSWTFAKQLGFFDVVTYNGTGSTQDIPHSLGSVPGMIIVKKSSGADNWQVWHKSISTGSLSSNDLMKLDQDVEKIDRNSFIGTANSSTFEVGTDNAVNASGGDYVAYIFADGDQADAQIFGDAGDESIIKCGSYTPSGSDLQVDCGWEPQWLMVKDTDSGTVWKNWGMFDNMRGVVTDGNDTPLMANLATEEGGTYMYGSDNIVDFNANGFLVKNGISLAGTSGNTFIYVAIRRGPMKTPEAGTEVFKALHRTGTGSASSETGFGFSPDLVISRRTDAGGTGPEVFDKVRGRSGLLDTTLQSAESNYSGVTDDLVSFDQDGLSFGTGSYSQINYTSRDIALWNFKRAPGFFDVVAYEGNGAQGYDVPHNLGVAPEMIIVKSRSLGTENWPAYAEPLGNTHSIYLNSSAGKNSSNAGWWDNTTPDESKFRLGDLDHVNKNTETYIAYLFATLPGISKVGSYTGTGNDIDVDCGFTSGARFVMVKRTDAAGDWYVWDTTRGIVSGDDPRITLSATGAEVTNQDNIDPYNSGFTITDTTADAINQSGGTYIYLAIA